MKLGVLFSGGKDSCFACYKAMKKEEVACLITLLSKNPESYMFHTANIEFTKVQAKAIGLPLVAERTKGEKEKELKDLRKAIEVAKRRYKIEGIVSGAILSVYQAIRIQKICNELGLWCFNPLWQIDQEEYLKEFISSGFKAVISGVFAYPFDESWLGKIIDNKLVEKLSKLNITLTGEGGEFETFVVDGPIFKKRIEIKKVSKIFKEHAGILKIEEVELK
jgi:ABC transporter with metal-binding/Fe-S-binding domain ATP-binding protein